MPVKNWALTLGADLRVEHLVLQVGGGLRLCWSTRQPSNAQSQGSLTTRCTVRVNVRRPPAALTAERDMSTSESNQDCRETARIIS